MKILHTELREDFGLLDQRLITVGLLAERGILSVACEPRPHCLSIEYDPAVLDNAHLLTIMCRYGLFPKSASSRPDAQLAARR
jgi:hypothetical protein